MKKFVPIFFLFILAISSNAQTVLYDFEAPETSTTFQIFGSALEGTLTTVIPNPDATGVNTSANVMEYVKAGDAQTWGGAFTNPAPASPIDATNGGQVCMDIWMDHVGPIRLKLEISPDNPANWEIDMSNTTANAWETICFDLDMNSLAGDMTPATGKMFSNLVIFPDFGTAGAGTDLVYYLDNFTVPESGGSSVVCTTLFDFDNTTTDFSYFGSSLEGGTTTVIANPNASGINTSGSVMEYIKGGDAQTWAGAAITPELTEPIDGTLTEQICVKVHWDHPGNLALKLELDAFDDPNNWITQQEITTINEWTEICFDLSQPSLEGNMLPAAGFVFYKIILFPDFGIAGTGMDVSSYLDDFVVKTSNVINNYDVTFRVDMSEYADPFTQVYVSGTFNTWSGDANPLDDSDGDGVWETTLTIPQGALEYKFTLDNWTGQEMFDGTDVCTVSTDDGMGNINTNRALVLTDNTTLEAVCYNSCYACGNSVNITWNVNMSEETVSMDGVFLAGGPFFGHGELEMTDPDGDQTYSITLEREVGFTTDYTFINGICLPDWSCKENIAGQDCAVQPYNDRNLPATNEDTVISTCFGQCTTDGSCTPAPMYNVTFNVDMSQETGVNQVFIMGNTINNWNPAVTELLDPESDNIYTVTVSLFPGAHEYKFLNGTADEMLTQGDDCTITDQSGQFTNRLLILGEADTTLNAVYFGSCDETVSIKLIEDQTLIDIYPNLASDFIQVTFNETSNDQEINIYDLTGKVHQQSNLSFVQNQQINVADFAPGIYFIQVKVGDKITTKKIVKQ